MFGSYPYPRNLYARNTLEFLGVFVKEGKPIPVASDVRSRSRLSSDDWRNYTRQVWDIPAPNRGDLAWGAYAAIMPEEIPFRMIRMFSFYGDLVLDPFTGSGTTLKVAKELGCRYVGYEVYWSCRSVIRRKLESVASPYHRLMPLL